MEAEQCPPFQCTVPPRIAQGTVLPEEDDGQRAQSFLDSAIAGKDLFHRRRAQGDLDLASGAAQRWNEWHWKVISLTDPCARNAAHKPLDGRRHIQDRVACEEAVNELNHMVDVKSEYVPPFDAY